MTDQTNAAGDAVSAKDQEATDWIKELRNLALLLVLVLVFHSFIAKPFYIPSASMMPGLIEGDRLWVSKYPYGWSFSSISFHLMPPTKGRVLGSTPERGDVVIVEPNGVRKDYIKRVIGLPGDTVAVQDGTVILNGVPVKREQMPDMDIPVDANMPCDVSASDGDPAEFPVDVLQTLPDGKQVCRVHIMRETLPNGATYDTIEMDDTKGDHFAQITVPPGHVFLMGDNRDRSADSRFPSAAQDPNCRSLDDPYCNQGLGGPVPLEQVGGRAEFIAFSMDGSGSYFNPISWFTTMRSGRFGVSLRPKRVAVAPAAPSPAVAPASAPTASGN